LAHGAVRRLASEDGRDKVEIGFDPKKGRGIYARAAIQPGELIDSAPVIVFDAVDCARLDRTRIGHYYFHWDGDAEGDGRGALALGRVTLCNHSPRPKAKVRRNLDAEMLDLVAVQPIHPGEEVTIDYGCTLWFDASE
jgi:uncharacterized protein